MKKEILDLEIEIRSMLAAFRVNYKQASILNDTSVCFTIDDFGVVLCAVSQGDYSLIKRSIDRKYDNWRAIYITSADFISDKRDEVLWDLMRSGYMTFIRNNYNRQFVNLIINSLGQKIINKRLEIWGDSPKHKWLVEENKMAKRESATYILSKNSAFFDYMPCEEKTYV